MNTTDERNDRILRRVKKLLILSDNNANEEEAHILIIQNQQLMTRRVCSGKRYIAEYERGCRKVKLNINNDLSVCEE